MTSQASKSELLQTLRMLLREGFRLRNQGAAYAKISRAQGYADGYMRMLLDARIVDQAELLRLIGEERCGIDGPATTTVAATTADETQVVAA
jgi:hypothetical protein